MENLNQRQVRFGYESISIITEAKIDNIWCEMVAEAYRDANYRTVIETPHYLLRTIGPGLGRDKYTETYRKIKLANPVSTTALLDGKLEGAKMIRVPVYDQEQMSTFYDQQPHLVLSNVVELVPYGAKQPQEISIDFQGSIFVPLTEVYRNFTLFPAESF